MSRRPSIGPERLEDVFDNVATADVDQRLARLREFRGTLPELGQRVLRMTDDEFAELLHLHRVLLFDCLVVAGHQLDRADRELGNDVPHHPTATRSPPEPRRPPDPKNRRMGILTSIRERLTRRQRDEQHAAIATYSELVTAVHEERPPDDDDLLAILDAAGKSLDDLEADVELHRQRLAWGVESDALDDLRAELDAIRAEQQAHQAERERVFTELNRRSGELGTRHQDVTRRISAAEKARQNLLAHPADHELANRLDALRRERGRLVGQRQEIGIDLWGRARPQDNFEDSPYGSTGNRAIGLESEIEKHTDPAKRNEARRRYQAFKAREIDPLVEKHHELGERVARLDKQIADLERQLLVP